MARHRSDGLGMASPAGEVLVESADVAPGVPAAVQVGHVRGFHERPLQVPIDVRAQPAAARVPARGADARRGAGAAGQSLGIREAADVAHLERDHDGQDEAHPGQRPELLDRRGRREHRTHPLFERPHLALQALDLLEASVDT